MPRWLTFPTLFIFRANAQQPKLFVGMILILIFAEALALYGLIGTLALAVGVLHVTSCLLRWRVEASFCNGLLVR